MSTKSLWRGLLVSVGTQIALFYKLLSILLSPKFVVHILILARLLSPIFPVTCPFFLLIGIEPALVVVPKFACTVKTLGCMLGDVMILKTRRFVAQYDFPHSPQIKAPCG